MPPRHSDVAALRVFSDTSVLFAAVHGNGRSADGVAPGASLTLCQMGQGRVLDLVISQQVLDEAHRALARKDPKSWPALGGFVSISASLVTEADPETMARAAAVVDDPSDAPILAAAACCGSRFLVTLNPRHFPAEFSGVTVVTPGDLVALVRRSLLGIQRL